MGSGAPCLHLHRRMVDPLIFCVPRDFFPFLSRETSPSKGEVAEGEMETEAGEPAGGSSFEL